MITILRLTLALLMTPVIAVIFLGFYMNAIKGEFGFHTLLMFITVLFIVLLFRFGILKKTVRNEA